MARTILKKGIDVSKHQGKIDWSKVKAAGIDFAMIRVGYRGYSTGKIAADPDFMSNITGAEAAGLQIGAYFFSTGLNEAEAREEAAHCIERLKGHKVTMPVVFDFEGYELPHYRTYGISKAQRTACCQAFIDVITAAGYTTMLYGSRGNIRTTYDIDALDYPLWIARYAGGYDKILSDDKYFPDITGYSDRIAIWQYTSIGRVDGINGNVDMNYMYIDVSKKEEEEYKMIKPVDYKQTDARWGSNRYAVDGESSTIKSAGCGPTAMADVLAAIVSEYIDPLTCAAWARQHGYKVYKSGTSYSYPVAQAEEYGVKVRRLNTSNVYGKPQATVHNQVLEELRNGNWVIACMGKGLWTSSGHYIVAYGVDGGMVYINDPASGRADRACNRWQTFISQVKYYWVVEVPDSIKGGGIVKGGAYRHEDFVREVQMCIKAGIDGKAGTQTLSRTVTVSKVRNRKHNVVLPLQKALKKRGMYLGELDRIAGSGFKAAVDAYQSSVLKYRSPDGEITTKGKMWRSMLGM